MDSASFISNIDYILRKHLLDLQSGCVLYFYLEIAQYHVSYHNVPLTDTLLIIFRKYSLVDVRSFDYAEDIVL